MILLVEAKSVRPTDAVRKGAPKAATELERMLAKAHAQVNTTEALIAEGRPEFAHLPRTRRRVGLITTMEDFHVINSPFHRELYSSTSSIPTIIASVGELEHFVTVKDQAPGKLICDHLADAERTGWSLKSALVGHTHRRNEIIDRGWNSYPWAGIPDESEESSAV